MVHIDFFVLFSFPIINIQCILSQPIPETWCGNHGLKTWVWPCVASLLLHSSPTSISQKRHCLVPTSSFSTTSLKAKACFHHCSIYYDCIFLFISIVNPHNPSRSFLYFLLKFYFNILFEYIYFIYAWSISLISAKTRFPMY